jgi:biopolymer transport protein ExbD
MNARADKAKRVPGVNVTPLVDVLLVLLIIFMVITPMLQKGFQTQVPKRDGGGGSTAIVLQLFKDGRMALNQQVVPEGDLPARLTAIYATRSDKSLFLDAEDRVHYDAVVRALDLCRAPGRAETIGFELN